MNCHAVVIFRVLWDVVHPELREQLRKELIFAEFFRQHSPSQPRKLVNKYKNYTPAEAGRLIMLRTGGAEVGLQLKPNGTQNITFEESMSALCHIHEAFKDIKMKVMQEIEKRVSLLEEWWKQQIPEEPIGESKEEPMKKGPLDRKIVFTFKDPKKKDPMGKDPMGKDPKENDPKEKDPKEKDSMEKDSMEKDPKEKYPMEKDPMEKPKKDISVEKDLPESVAVDLDALLNNVILKEFAAKNRIGPDLDIEAIRVRPQVVILVSDMLHKYPMLIHAPLWKTYIGTLEYFVPNPSPQPQVFCWVPEIEVNYTEEQIAEYPVLAEHQRKKYLPIPGMRGESVYY